ncbi:hypothetical protein G9A89_003708 [Geosiphon pyriformis]|nr:hypothetical protein G9A89_003708 [Geosiphon pyriformis]
MNKPLKAPKRDRKRAAQIEAALKKCNPNILDKINNGNSVLETKKQMDNPFVANKDKTDLDDNTEDMEDSELGLSSRMASPSSGQYSSKSLGKKPMIMEPNYEEDWKTVVHRTKRHVLFVQAVDIPEKIMGKKVVWIYNLLGDVSYLLGAVMARNQKIQVDFSQMAGRDQARKILASKEIESFLMATDDITNQMADKKVGAAMKEFGEIKKVQIKVAGKWQSAVNCTAHYLSTTLDQIKARFCFIPRTSKNYTRMGCAYIGFNSEASHNSATKKPLVPADAKECHFCYQVGHLVSKCPTLHKKKEENTKKVTNNIRLAKLYVRRNVLEEIIKAFGGRSYAEMAAFRLSYNINNTITNKYQKPTKLLSAVAAKLQVTVKKRKDIIVTQQQSFISKKKKEVENELLSQSTISKSNLAEKKEVYNPEIEIKEISLLIFMTTNRTKSKKVANITFPIVTNKVSTREDLSVIEAARQNVLATFPLKNTSDKLPLTASGSFFSALAGSSSPIKVFSKRHTWVSFSVVSTTSKSPKIFNNRPVLPLPLLFLLLLLHKWSQKQKIPKKSSRQLQLLWLHQAPDKIFNKISTAAASSLPDIDGNSSGISPKMGQDQPLAVLPNVVLSGRSSLIPVAKQPINLDDFKDWAD